MRIRGDMNMKNYFPHDSDARSDDKIIALRIKHKWEGYGLYWALIEKLRESKNYTLKADYNVLAFDLRADAAILKSVINDFGLFAFTDNGECFYSESLNTRMQPLDEKRAKLSDAGKRGNKKRWKNGSSQSASQSPPDNNSFATQSPPDSHPIAHPSQEEIREEENNNSISIGSDEPICGTLQPHSERINYDELIKFFNIETKGIFGTIRSPLSDTRKGLINARIKTHGKDMFADMIRKAYQSDFLKGQNKNGWRASFDWLIKPTNFEKVISGNYDNKNIRNGTTQSSVNEDFMRNIAEGIARGNLEREQRDE